VRPATREVSHSALEVVIRVGRRGVNREDGKKAKG
jgi:hypothetical protein